MARICLRHAGGLIASALRNCLYSTNQLCTNGSARITIRSRLRSIAASAAKAAIYPAAKLFDRHYLASDIPAPTLTSHADMRGHVVAAGNKPGLRVLEIGSRDVTGSHGFARMFDKGEYVGFDYYAGPNVDVVGDAHKLSSYFSEPFDVIYSTAVLEHLAMPWIAAEEIAKVLKVGGLLFMETHFSTSVHERPWHFFQFSDMALRALFSPALGFECIEASMSNPIVGRYSVLADPYLRLRPAKGLYCHSAFLGRKVCEVRDFDWHNVDIGTITGATHYPSASGLAEMSDSSA